MAHIISGVWASRGRSVDGVRHKGGFGGEEGEGGADGTEIVSGDEVDCGATDLSVGEGEAPACTGRDAGRR